MEDDYNELLAKLKALVIESQRLIMEHDRVRREFERIHEELQKLRSEGKVSVERESDTTVPNHRTG